jgi:hypothetical protein
MSDLSAIFAKAALSLSLMRPHCWAKTVHTIDPIRPATTGSAFRDQLVMSVTQGAPLAISLPVYLVEADKSPSLRGQSRAA